MHKGVRRQSDYYTAAQMHKLQIGIACLFCLIVTDSLVMAADPPAQPQQQQAQSRPRPPVAARDPNTPGFVKAKELEDGAVPSPEVDGNFIIGPTHKKAEAMNVKDGVPKGTIHNLTMKSEDSKFYPGIARERGTFGTPDPQNPA